VWPCGSQWARLASHAPGLANALAPAATRLAGLAPERAVPRFAPQTFRAWFRERPPRREGTPVVLWPDTFTNYLQPEVGRAAVEVLEAPGHRVRLPPDGLCCGRPLYDYGMLTLARRRLRQIVDALRPQIAAGTPVVGLEPSCVAVFRDELVNLLPGEEARRLSAQTVHLSELLERNGWEPPRLARKAVLHAHCHHKAVMKAHAEEALLARLGLALEVLDAGCCGLAGSFGYERGQHYELSMQIGERVLFPAVRAAPDDALLVADGFSCRQQVAHGTGRRELHLAEVLALALRER
jgi:Fe-S oxidoreductase